MEHQQIIEIIRKHKTDCEEASSRFNELESSHIPRETLQRKQYAIAAQIELLESILREIEPEGEYWIVDHPLLHD